MFSRIEMFSRIGLMLLPIVCDLMLSWEKFSLSRWKIFLCTFSFQTNFLAFLYFFFYILWPETPFLWTFFQSCSVIYLSVVFFFWLILLGGKEDDINEQIINILLHYVQPLIVIIHWLRTEQKNQWPKAHILFIYPVCYYIFLKILERKMGYSLYPMLKDELIKVILCLCVFTYGLVYLNNLMKKIKKN